MSLGDIRFPDHHGTEEASTEDLEPGWDRDNVFLRTVGVDIGSTTSHLMFSRLHLQRLSQSLSSRFVVVERAMLYRSPILLTPYRADGRIDADGLASFVARAYEEAGIAPRDVDTGAVILTGVALESANARAVAELFATEGGRFVCAAAGHRMEALLAAHGSGAIARSRAADEVVLNVDLGGGTTKLALIEAGEVLGVTAIALGARLIVVDEDGRITRIEPAGAELARQLGVKLAIGAPLEARARTALALAMADFLIAAIYGKRDATFSLLPEPLPAYPQPHAITFSGGVAEFIHGRAQGSFGDLGGDLAAAILRRREQLPAPIVEAAEGIRATVIGASQFTVQLSGNTIYLSDPALLPLRNLPVATARLEARPPVAREVAEAIREGMIRLDLTERDEPLAVAIRWRGEPRYASVRALAEGIRDAVGARRPVVVATEGDIGRTVGAILVDELRVAGGVVVVDGLELADLDFIDLGALVEPAHAVPVIVKSLIFADNAT